MKRFFALFLSCCILGQAFVRTAWVLHYQWNRVIYLSHCTNQNQPNLHCDGKCYLKKKMAEAEDNTGAGAQKLPEGLRNGKDLQLFCETDPGLPALAVLSADVLPHPPYPAFFSEAHKAGVFRPPAV